MSSIIRVDTLQKPDGSTPTAADLGIDVAGSVVQVVTASSTAGGATNGASPAYNVGYNLFAQQFTPKYSNSIIVVQTSDVMIAEQSNFANLCWLGAWADTTQIGVTSGTAIYTNFGSAENHAYKSLNHSIASWGAGVTKTINVRASMDSGSGTVYVNYQSYSDWGVPAYRTVGLTIFEIAQ